VSGRAISLSVGGLQAADHEVQNHEGPTITRFMVAITTAVSRCSISARWTVAGVHQRPEPSDVAWVLLIPPCGELRTLALIADTTMQRLFAAVLAVTCVVGSTLCFGRSGFTHDLRPRACRRRMAMTAI
jgi:hypothetical protein